jgi:hypothetical protein
LAPKFEAMLGFTQAEVHQLLDEIYHDYDIDPANRAVVEAVIKNHYDGYHFITTDGEDIYNSTILMYFLNKFINEKTIPKRLTDLQGYRSILKNFSLNQIVINMLIFMGLFLTH